MESVRWFLGATPGPNSTTRKTVPLFNVVPTLRSPSSALPVLLTGKDSVVQTTHAVDPGRLETRLLETSSILTAARPFASCPVTTRRRLRTLSFSFLDLGHHQRCGDHVLHHDVIVHTAASSTLMRNAELSRPH